MNLLATFWFYKPGVEVYIILAILGVPVYFFVKWLLKKLIKAERNRKIATWVSTVVLTPLLYLGIIMAWIFGVSYYPSHDFSREKWVKEREKRYEYSEEIIETKLLIGKTKAEVRQVLGDEGQKDQDNHWTYYLGFVPGPFTIDPDVLYIEFKDGKVVHVAQHRT